MFLERRSSPIEHHRSERRDPVVRARALSLSSSLFFSLSLPPSLPSFSPLHPSALCDYQTVPGHERWFSRAFDVADPRDRVATPTAHISRVKRRIDASRPFVRGVVRERSQALCDGETAADGRRKRNEAKKRRGRGHCGTPSS